jgi:UPF0716 protein FxsA
MRTLAKLFTLFTLVTVIELFLLVELAELTSWWVTIATVIVPGLLGAWLAKREGSRAIRQVREALTLQQEPSRAIIDGAIVLVASVFLLTPGVLTDVAGLLLLVPPIRARVRSYVAARVGAAIRNRIESGSIQFAGASRARSPFDDGSFEVIDADEIPKPGPR